MKITYVYGALVVLLIVGLVIARNSVEPEPSEESATAISEYDSFAQCISDSGAKFYGTYWCPHCKEQKALFENSKKLPYIECSTPNGQAQTQVCLDAGIKSYPTWEFADGSRESGMQTFEKLSEKTSCPVPQQ
jgi:thiol-disulfide isomerase/thioredoxin